MKRPIQGSFNMPYQAAAEQQCVYVKDTDVLLLLVAHFQNMQCSNLWMMTRKSKKRKYIPVGEVYNRLPADFVSSLLPFHVLTRCDVTSYISNHTKNKNKNSTDGVQL